MILIQFDKVLQHFTCFYGILGPFLSAKCAVRQFGCPKELTFRRSAWTLIKLWTKKTITTKDYLLCKRISCIKLSYEIIGQSVAEHVWIYVLFLFSIFKTLTRGFCLWRLVVCHRALLSLNPCSLKAGHAITTCWIYHILPNFKILPDTLTNIYLGSRPSKSGDKAEPIKFFVKYSFLLEVG